MLDIENLKNEIEHQNRNGRNEIYLRTKDLKELGIPDLENVTKDRIYIKEDILQEYIDAYCLLNYIKQDEPYTYLDTVDTTGYHFRCVKT